MEYVLIPLVAALVSALTLISGFGLGTLLMPAFAVFFPLELAIAATGVVHFANNLFKLALVGRWANRSVVLKFGLPAVLAGLAGAVCLTLLVAPEPFHTYTLGSHVASITWLKVIIALLLLAFALLEFLPAYQRLSFGTRLLPLGGVLSGFFGGISGMQGALRAPFLLRAGLTHQQFVGTTNIVSTMVDAARLIVYAAGFAHLARVKGMALPFDAPLLTLVGLACLAGFLGSYLGAKWIPKITMKPVRVIVALLLGSLALALGAGLI